LRTLHHQLSDLRAHVDIGRREVALAKRVGSSRKGMEPSGQNFRRGQGIIRDLGGDTKSVLNSPMRRPGNARPPGHSMASGPARKDSCERSSRNATAPLRRELTNRSALGRETKGKSSSTEARAKTVRDPKCFKSASACF
jgi:hypothetical protein